MLEHSGRPPNSIPIPCYGALPTSAAKRYHLRYGHIGHLFQGPFRYKAISEEALWYVAAYIHLNPVRAVRAGHPAEWKYSNFAEFDEGFLPARDGNDKGNLHLWKGYADYVLEYLRDDRGKKTFGCACDPKLKVSFHLARSMTKETFRLPTHHP